MLTSYAPSNVRFASLEAVLLTLGFTRHPIPQTYHYFTFEGSKAVVAVRPYAPDELVYPTNIGAARATIEDFGIADRATFDRILAEQVARYEATAA